ncbi:MAG: hypothetical protein KF894_02690 [Labilithrix sp.]|nr:hypothetical protein [Labilithrix sp.]
MTRRRLLALCFAALAAVLVVTPPRIARADDEPKQEELPRRQANFAWDKNDKTKQTLLRASFSSRDVIDKAMADKLASGLPTVIAMRAYLLREGEANPVALAVRTCRVVYDLWDEVYRLKISSAGAERDSAALNLEGVLRQCAEARDLPIADRALLTAGTPHFLGVIVEVNPVSPQMLAQMRQWVSRPAGSTGIGPGDALFGSFVGLFVRQIGNADRTLRFRTQSLTP